MTLKEYPLDIDGIKAVGIDSWLENFRAPRDGYAYHRTWEKVFGAYKKAMATQGDGSPVFMAGIVYHKLVINIAINYYKYLMLVQLKKDGVEVVPEKGHIDQLISQQRKFFPFQKYDKEVYRNDILRERIRYFRQNQGHSLLARLGMSCQGDHAVIGDPDEPLLRSYLRDHAEKPFFLRAILHLAHSSDALPEDTQHNVTLFVNTFIESMDGDSNYFDHTFRENFRSFIAKAAATYLRACQTLPEQPLPPLVVGTVFSESARFVAAAWKSKGGKVIGLSHGNVFLTGAYGRPIYDGTTWLCDSYVTGAPGYQLQLQKVRDQVVATEPLCMNGAIDVQNDGYLVNTYERLKESATVTEIKKVMIVGAPIDYHWMASLYSYNTYTFIALELKVIRILRDAGYRVIYKAHPDTASESVKLYASLVDEFVTDDFSRVFEDTDCFFYASPLTSTFGVGVLTQIPVVYVDHEQWKWDPEIRELLDLRAVPFYVSFDDHDAVQVDSQKLLGAVQESLKRNDHSVVEKYAFESEDGSRRSEDR